jgi:hypothetical protein
VPVPSPPVLVFVRPMVFSPRPCRFALPCVMAFLLLL